MGDRGAAVEDSGRRKGEGAKAQADDLRAVRVGAGYAFAEPSLYRSEVGMPRRDDDDIGDVESFRSG